MRMVCGLWGAYDWGALVGLETDICDWIMMQNPVIAVVCSIILNFLVLPLCLYISAYVCIDNVQSVVAMWEIDKTHGHYGFGSLRR